MLYSISYPPTEATQYTWTPNSEGYVTSPRLRTPEVRNSPCIYCWCFFFLPLFYPLFFLPLYPPLTVHELYIITCNQSNIDIALCLRTVSSMYTTVYNVWYVAVCVYCFPPPPPFFSSFCTPLGSCFFNLKSIKIYST